jgi:dihydroneopterin triphosphate diphosphatase
MDLPIKAEVILYALVNGEYKFLIIKRVPADGGFWQPLTEGLEEGETIEECLKRGIKEELGIETTIKVTERIWSFSWENKRGEPNIDLVYGVELSIDEKVTINPAEHSEYKWCSFNEAIKLLEKDSNKEAFMKFKEKIMGRPN